MTDGMIWFALVAGFVIALVAVTGIVEAVGRRTINRMAVEVIKGGGYTQDEIERIVQEWAAESDGES